MAEITGVRRGPAPPKLTLVGVLLLISVILNIFLARKVSRSTAMEMARSESLLRVGTAVPAIEGRSVDGAKKALDYHEVQIPTILYVFSPQCGWCEKNLDNLKALVGSSGSRYRVVGISLSHQDLKEYVEEKALALPVYTDIADPIRTAYRLGATPTTIVVSPEGKVLKVWSGVYSDRNRQEIEAYLDIHLPGCCK